jgi:dipeptidyl aminopeptidase/acylaminoacyl peptidase
MKVREQDHSSLSSLPESGLSPESQAIALKWLRRAGLVALGVVGSLTVALGAASFPLSGLLIRPKMKRLAQLKSPHLKNLIKRIGVELEEITIESFDGTRLYGWWLPIAEKAPTIVVLHGVKKNRTDVVRAALILRLAGFNVLVFDGRGHGHSERRFVTYGFYERRDVESAIEWIVNERGVRKENIGLAGESMGAAIALQVAAHNPWIKAVWADSPFASLERITSEFVEKVTHLPKTVLHPVLWTTIQVANYRGKFDVRTIDPLALARKIKCAVYLVHGTADQLIAVEHSSNIYDALAGEKTLWLVEGARHARSARHAKEQYSQRLIEFFSEQLKLPLRSAARNVGARLRQFRDSRLQTRHS